MLYQEPLLVENESFVLYFVERNLYVLEKALLCSG